MKLIKNVAIGLAIMAAFAGSAQASLINVGGVVWDPDSPVDFSGTTATITQTINPGTGELTGFGNVTIINNTNQSVFCPGCELTIQYSGFTPFGSSAVPAPVGTGTQIQYTGGSVRLFVDSTPETNGGTTMTSANTGDGILWANFVGHAQGSNNITFTGTNNFPDNLQGFGLLDVIAGLAFGNLNTNSKTGGSDLSFSTTFTNFPGGSPLDGTGSGTFNGNSIPEPGSIALIGLGLLGAAFARRRKSVE